MVGTDRREWYKALGLSPGASPEDIGTAYRDLVKIWHPDRFKSDPRVREKAEAKLKELNEAYRGLLPALPEPEPQPPQASGLDADSPRGLPGFDPFGRESQRHWLQPTATRRGEGSRGLPKRDLPWNKIALISMLATIAMAARVWVWPIATVTIGGSSHPVTPVLPAQTANPAPAPVSPPRAVASPPPPPAPEQPALESSVPKPPAPAVPKAPMPRHRAVESPAPLTPRSTASSSPASGETAKPYDGVIMLVTDGPFGSREYGTAFLIDRAKAITTSRVVADAARYQFSLAAITLDYRAYRAQVVCQSPIPGRRQTQGEAAAGKDVAFVQVDWNSPIKSLKVNAQAATPKNPGSFNPLSLNRLGLHPGERVLIVGYGRQKSGVTQLRQVGVVTAVSRTADGTAVFTGKFPRLPAPAERGAPVLNSAGEVVGVWAWETPAGDISGGGISAPSLACP